MYIINSVFIRLLTIAHGFNDDDNDDDMYKLRAWLINNGWKITQVSYVNAEKSVSGQRN